MFPCPKKPSAMLLIFQNLQKSRFPNSNPYPKIGNPRDFRQKNLPIVSLAGDHVFVQRTKEAKETFRFPRRHQKKLISLPFFTLLLGKTPKYIFYLFCVQFTCGLVARVLPLVPHNRNQSLPLFQTRFFHLGYWGNTCMHGFSLLRV